jgi:hypothetical protein
VLPGQVVEDRLLHREEVGFVPLDLLGREVLGQPLGGTTPVHVGDTQQAEAPFHRPPRSLPDSVPSEELRIHAPPTKPEPPSGGVMPALFPVIGSFSMLGFALVYRRRLFMCMAFGLVCLSLLFAVAMRWSQARGVRKRPQRNRHEYRMCLTGVERQLSNDTDPRLAASERLYPDHERLWGLVLAKGHLWERRVRDGEFLQVRVGRGRVPHARRLRLDLERLFRAVPDARAMITVAADAETASELSAGEYSWERAPDAWSRSLRELAAVMVADWPELGLAT